MRRSIRRNIVKSAAGYVVEALEGRTLLSFQANVNFQDDIASLPEGYLRDRGSVYGARIGGGVYGWDADNSANARNRDTEPDQRLDTFNHMQLGGANRSWSISVPNDTYRVRIVAGDPDNFNSVYKIAAEGVTVVDGTPDTNNRWITGTQTVTVTDGQLTITNAAGSSNNKICYIEIVDSSRLASVPAAPTNLKALAETTTKVNLTWTDNADNDTAYKVERSPNGTSGWTLFDRYSDATFFGDVTGLSANTTWYYRVRAANTAGFSAWSDIVQVTTPATNAQTPYNATATPWAIGTVIEAENYDRGGEGVASHDVDTTNSGGLYRTGYVDIIRYTAYAQVGTFVGFNEAGEWLEYTINVPQTGTYRLEASVSNRDAGDGTFYMSVDGVDKTGLLTIPDTGAWTTFQTITKSGVSLTAGQHVLRVTIDSIGTNQSAAGNINWFNFVLTSSSSVPTAPSNLTALLVTSSQVNLAWADNSSSETGYEVDRSTSPTFSSGITTVTLGANVTSYSAIALSSNTTYYFRVRATNATGDSANSNTANATTPSLGTIPSAPTGLTATAISSSQINLSWTDASSNESGFKIDRSLSSTFASGVTTVSVAPNTTTHAVTGLAASTLYYFRVRAANAAGESANSGTSNATTQSGVTLPSVPTGLAATVASSTQINLSWTDTSNNESGFEVDRSTSSTFASGVTTTTTAANASSLNVTSLTANTTYYFRVRSTNAAGDSQNSGTAVSRTSTPTVPSGVAATAASSSQINIAWTDASNNESGFEVDRATNSTFTANLVTNTAPKNATGYSATGLSASTTYYFRVRSTNAIGDSTNSSTVSTTTGASSSFTLDLTAASTSRIDMSWTAKSGAASYRIEISQDGIDFYQSESVDASDTTAVSEGFYPGEKFYFRVVAVDASGVDIGTSNTDDATTLVATPPMSPDAIYPSLAFDQQVNAAGKTPLLVAFNGAYLAPFQETLDITGNRWFERIARDAGNSIKSPVQAEEGRITYRDTDWNLALFDLLARIDVDGDQDIEPTEIDDFDIVIAGYSWGGVAAANLTRKLRQGFIPIPGGVDGFYNIQADVPIQLLITIDPQLQTIPRILRWQSGPVETNVQRLVNYYQRRGGSTTFKLYPNGSSGNGSGGFNPAVAIAELSVVPPFGGPLKGTTLQNNLAAGDVNQQNVTGFGARYATYVQFSLPTFGDAEEVFDADLTAANVQHDMIPWYVRGQAGAGYDSQFNALKEIDDAFQ